VSASDARLSRRLLRKQLRAAGARCNACGAELDERCYRGLWIDGHGRVHEHLVCHTCITTAAANQEATDELATKCALALCEPGGSA
jgi:hypothetical protein